MAAGLGLSGSHRTGKTTLAAAFAEQEKRTFVRTSASEVFALLGKDPKVDYPIGERIAIQEAILYAFERQYQEAEKRDVPWISDRTPIDLASYMMADVMRGTFEGEPEFAMMVNDYVARCIAATNLWFSTVILVQPGIKVVEAPGKAPGCPAYIEHLNVIQAGLLINEDLVVRHYMIPRRFTDLESRIECLKNTMIHAGESNKQMGLQREAYGFALH